MNLGLNGENQLVASASRGLIVVVPPPAVTEVTAPVAEDSISSKEIRV